MSTDDTTIVPSVATDDVAGTDFCAFDMLNHNCHKNATRRKEFGITNLLISISKRLYKTWLQNFT